VRERAFVWLLLGGAVLVFFGDAWEWWVIAGIPWLVGGICLMKLSEDQLAAAHATLRESVAARVAVVILGFLVLVATDLFGLEGGLLGLTFLLTLAAAWLLGRGVDRTVELLVGLATSGVTMLILVVAAEALVSRPSIGALWGSTEEQRSWEAERYDALAMRGNVFRFRSPYERTAKPPNAFRIVVLGDSFTWGDKVARTEDLWTSRLESLLDREVTGRDVEVVNLGMKGFTTANEVELMERLGWQFDPDLVLIQFYANDAYPSRPNFGRADSDVIWPTYRIVPSRLRDGAAGRSELLIFLEGRLNRILVNADHASLYRDDYEGWVQVQGALRELGHQARDRGVPAALIMNPHFVRGRWTVDTHPYSAVYDKVAVVARQAGLRVLDLRLAFASQGQPGEHWWATPYDAHPNEEAHAVIARATAEFLRASELVP